MPESNADAGAGGERASIADGLAKLNEGVADRIKGAHDPADEARVDAAMERWKDTAGGAEMDPYRPTLMPSAETWAHITRMADDLSRAVALPAAIRGKPADIALVLLTGRDVGVGPTTALNKIYVIEGRPTMAAELMRALIIDRGHDIWFEDVTDDAVTVCAHRANWPTERVARVTWTLEMAQTADLARKDVWKKFRRSMLKARATSEMARDNFPDVLLGVSYCLPTRAEALTRDGWRSSDKLHEGDEILLFDPERGCSSWGPIERLHRFAAAETYRLRSRSFSAVATGEHSWYVEQKHDQRIIKRTTLTLKKGEPRLIVAASAEAEASSCLDERDAAIAGWLLTDGCIYKRGDEWSIGQSKHVATVRSLLVGEASENLVKVQERAPIIRGREVRATLPHYRWRLHKTLKDRLRRAGLYTKQDGTSIVTRLGERERRAMWEAMLLANGMHAAKRGARRARADFCTGRREVMDCFQALAALLGERLGEEHNRENIFTVCVLTRRTFSTQRLAVEPETIEPVWCPHTPTGAWVCRMDGYVFITGNTPEELGADVNEEGEPLRVASTAWSENSTEAPAYQPAPGIVIDAFLARVDAMDPEVKRALATKWKHLRLRPLRATEHEPRVLGIEEVDIAAVAIAEVERDTPAEAEIVGGSEGENADETAAAAPLAASGPEDATGVPIPLERAQAAVADMAPTQVVEALDAFEVPRVPEADARAALVDLLAARVICAECGLLRDGPSMVDETLCGCETA